MLSKIVHGEGEKMERRKGGRERVRYEEEHITTYSMIFFQKERKMRGYE